MIEELIEILHREGLTLVIAQGNEIYRFHQRGVADLLSLLHNRPEVLKDAVIADKAVGKAAAACMVMGGVKQVHADVMSDPALDLLQGHGIIAEYSQLVDHIINRTGTDWCPLEKLSRNVSDPALIIQKIDGFFASKSTEK